MNKPKDAAVSAPQEILPPVPKPTGKGGKPKPDEADAELEGFMSEVESELRDEELRKLWKRYGGLVTAACFVLLFSVIGFQLWRQQQAEQRLELARRFEQAQADVTAGKTDDAMAIFGDVAKSRGEGYAALASLNQATILIQRKDVDGAVAIYKSIAADEKADRAFRDLATILHVQHTIDTADPKTLEPLLSPLTSPANSFHNAANELLALLAAKQGDYTRAAALAEQLLADTTTPQAMRARAQDLAGYYKAEAAKSPPAAAPQAPAASAPAATPPPDSSKSPPAKP